MSKRYKKLIPVLEKNILFSAKGQVQRDLPSFVFLFIRMCPRRLIEIKV